MLATGQSIVAVFNQLMERGTPAIHIAVVMLRLKVLLIRKHLPDHCHMDC
jgi:uracil phosphoribosyltransferase